MTQDKFYGTGRRKESVARVWLKPGNGAVLVNNRSMEDYFPRETLRMELRRPLVVTGLQERYDVIANVAGGGVSGQADAIMHGISRALLKLNAELRLTLRKGGFLTRDSRVKERKKYGQKGARARFQFSKR